MQNKGVVEVYFETIELKYPEEIGHYREDGFVYDLQSDNYKGYEKLTVYCYDREEDLIYGLTHELTEATITVLIHKFGYNHRAFVLDIYKPQHIMAVYSLPLYGFQKNYVKYFELLFRKHAKKTFI